MSATLAPARAALLLAGLAAARTLNSEYHFNPLHHLTGISPYFESLDPPASPDAPQGCTAERAAYLIRHGSIYANDFDYETYMEPFVDKLANRTGAVDWSRVPGLDFLAAWEPPVSEAETSLLTRVGKLQATQLGVDLFFRYPHLKVPPRVYASSAERTLKSAASIVRGFELDDNTINVVSIYESEQSGADGLTPYKGCPAYSSSAGSDESSPFQAKFTGPIKARLNSLAPGFNFTTEDVFGMMQFCGYETVIRGRSSFCDLDLFTPDDWLAWEYAEDLRYFYNAGYGNAVAGSIGLPWFNATAALLLADDSPEDLFVSVTHRQMPPMIMVAMGLFNNSEHFSGGSAAAINDTMPRDRVNHRRAWRASHFLPFLGNLAIERLNCSGSHGYDDGQYYRALVNSAPQPLPGCADGPGTSCSRAAFEGYVAERAGMFAGFTEACGVDYDNSTDTVSIYTDPSVGNGTVVGKRHEPTMIKGMM